MPVYKKALAESECQGLFLMPLEGGCLWKGSERMKTMKKTQKIFYHLFAIMLMCTLFCITKANVNAQEVYQGFVIDGVPEHLTSNPLTKGEHTLSMEGYEYTTYCCVISDGGAK